MIGNNQAKLRVWDIPVRLFHWTLVVLMVVSYITGRWGGDWLKYHFWSGYTILTLLLHAYWINILLILVGLHVLAALAYLVVKKQNLIGAMFTGRKPMDHVVPPGAPPRRLVFAPTRLAVSILIASAAIVYFIVR
jgi:cytochrome b